MNAQNQTYHRFVSLVAGITLAAATTLATVMPAAAFQGNMENAMSSLQEALAALRQATPNKGGHREQAVQLVEQALHQVQAGINFADSHGGGGAN